MKKQQFFLSVIVLLTLFSCTKEVFDERTDDTFDIKASKMEQIGSLFESISRQPYEADLLISVTEILYHDYTDLLPISDKAVFQRGKARGYSFSLLFASMARNPEAFDQLDAAATKFLGRYNPSYISSELAEITKIYTIMSISESIARNPEVDSLFNLVSKRYLNFEIFPGGHSR